MQKLLLFAAVLLCLAVSAFAVPNAAQAFASFKSQYNKQYDDPSEDLRRFQIFQENLEITDRLNKEHNCTAFGINTPFADLTHEEFKSKYLMNEELVAQELQSKPRKITYSNLQGFPPTMDIRNATPPFMNLRNATPPFINAPNIPIWDWNIVRPGSVSAIKNQGQCGSCWAFAATETLESRAFIEGMGAIVLSPQQIVDCTYPGRDGCGGGWYGTAWQYLGGTAGQTADGSYPYYSGNTGHGGGCQYNNGMGRVRPTSIDYIASNEGSVWNYLLTFAPISIAVDATYWGYYGGGDTAFPPSACGTYINHAVVVTGVAIINNAWHWRVRNSWGNWGSAGYIYLPVGVNACGIAGYPESVVI